MPTSPYDSVRALLFDRDAFDRRAPVSLQGHLARGSNWLWEEWVADTLDLPRGDVLVRSVGEQLRAHESPYRRWNYASREQRMTTCATLYEFVCDAAGESSVGLRAISVLLDGEMEFVASGERPSAHPCERSPGRYREGAGRPPQPPPLPPSPALR